MKEIAINLNYRGTDYTSDYDEFNKEEEEALKNMCKNIVKGEFNHFEFKGYNKTYYFPKSILNEAIITLVYR